MFRLRTLSLLAGMIAALAISAAPASAWFEATGKQLKGRVRVITPGSFSDGTGAAKFEVKCPEAEEIQGVWTIQTKGQIKDHWNQKTGKQVQTNFGPHLHIQIKTWGKCKAKIGGAEPPVEAKVAQCELQLVQQKGAFVATGAVVAGCGIEAGGCKVKVPPGMEKEAGSNEGINVGLKEVKLENAGENQLGKVEVKGIRAEKQLPSAGCPLNAVQEAELTGLEFEAVGVKAV